MTGRIWAWLAGLAGLVALLWAACAWHAGRVDARVAAELAAQRSELNLVAAQALAEAERKARDVETRAAAAALENQIEKQRLERLAQDGAGRARAADIGLQHATDDIRSRAAAAATDPAARSIADDASAAASALSECGSEYRALAAEADQLTIQVIGLQAYTTRVVLQVCPALPEGGSESVGY
jgi:hypothetical protein